MWVRMWRNENPCALMVGMQIGATTVENSMEGPQQEDLFLGLFSLSAAKHVGS